MRIKRIDRLVLSTFVGPFILTYLVVAFIFLILYLIKYFPDLVGKGLEWHIFAELFFYFAINVTPGSLPLAMLMSSLIAFGNLGEHFELTAIKSAGISLTRILVPIFYFSVGLCIAAFFINNNIVPKANLKAFSLLYDVRQKKPTFEFKEGTFYNGIPGYSIKVSKKYDDGKTMKGVMIYDHTQGRGNTDLIMADSGKMYLIQNDRFLIMDLYSGASYKEVTEGVNVRNQPFLRTTFDSCRFVFNMESFSIQRTQEELFSSHKIMRNISELKKDVDSLRKSTDTLAKQTIHSYKPFFNFLYREKPTKRYTTLHWNRDYEKDTIHKANVLAYATNSARSTKAFVQAQHERIKYLLKEANSYHIEYYKKFTSSIACFIMFLIGAPLGAIIKKGGLGVPVLISIIFFIIYYVLSIVAEKWAKEGVVEITIGMWITNICFLPIGLWFLKQARNDSRILETDNFYIAFHKLKQIFFEKILRKK